MEVNVAKVPGGFSLDGLELKNGKCGCTTVLPCCYSWSKIRRSGNAFTYTGKATSPESKENFNWSYTVKKGDYAVEVSMEDARDKKIFSGYYPPRIEEWTEKGWDVVKKEGAREDFNVWRCSACRWLFKEHAKAVSFESLPDDWKCPVCNVGKGSFERIA